MIYTLNEKRAFHGFPALTDVTIQQNRVDEFKTEVRKLAKTHGLLAEFKDGGNIGGAYVVQFHDKAGRFSVHIPRPLVTQNPLAVPFGVIKRNITRKDRGQW